MFADMYTTLYGKDSLYDALDEWGEIAKEIGISKAALAYRWVTFNSAPKVELGDGIIIGPKSASQLEEIIKAIEDGPLTSEFAERIEEIWRKVANEAPFDNFRDFFAKGGKLPTSRQEPV
jgi:aflatoxin B1 aldehyde reductase